MTNNAEPALTGRSMAQSAGFDIQLEPSVVLVYDQSLVPARASKRHHRTSNHPFRQVGTLDQGVDIVVATGPGAPVAGITIEFLAAFGVQRVVTVGSAGLLMPGPQNLTAITRAESDEGTSQHYGGHLTADPQLTAALTIRFGTDARVTLTTDAPFRHTPERLASHRNRASLVEMECAAIFAAAHHFGLQAASILVPSDVFELSGWRQFESHGGRTGLDDAVAVAMQVLAA